MNNPDFIQNMDLNLSRNNEYQEPSFTGVPVWFLFCSCIFSKKPGIHTNILCCSVCVHLAPSIPVLLDRAAV